jgi:hypothetical protein
MTNGNIPSALVPTLALLGPAMLATAATAAEPVKLQLGQFVPPPAAGPAQNPEQMAQAEERRRPGEPPPEPAVPPVMNPNAVPPPSAALPREFVPIPDRWRLVDALGLVQPHFYDPYNQNVLKGDKPIFGDYFLSVSLISDTLWEPRAIPVPTSVQLNEGAGRLSTYGRYRQQVVNQNLIGEFALIKGNTAYKPPDLEIRFTPVYNINYADVEERGLLKVNPAEGTERTDNFIGIQSAFVDYHIHNVSERYDFDSVRLGIQPFSSDFRGFLFQDSQLGARLFGTRDNNRWQYNLAYFRRLDKDTNSGLNDLGESPRQDDVIVANVYRQDFPVPGFTSQLIYAYNRNRETDQHFDKNGFLVRPALIGDARPREYDVHYLGYNGDGHFGRFNLTGSFYAALGSEDHNQFAGDKQGDDIRAFFAAVEPSVDFDWVRLRAQGLWASGDSNPFDHTATGFDAIYENPIFAGADTSYWVRQAIPLIGGGFVTLSPRNGVIPSLRSSKDQGQSNFINPGLFLAGVGADFDITPELRLATNANYLAFANTASIEALLNKGHVSPHIGFDISAAITYRPFFTNNVVLRLSGAVLIPQQGLKDIYTVSGTGDPSSDRFLYSVLANLILTY